MNVRIAVCGIQVALVWLCSYAPRSLISNLLSWICMSSLIYHFFAYAWVQYKKRLLQFAIKDSVMETLKEENPALHQAYVSKQLKGQKLTAYQEQIVSSASQLEQRFQKLYSEVSDEVTEPNFFNAVCCFLGEPEWLAPDAKIVHNAEYKLNTYNHPDCPICLEEWTEGTRISTLQGCGHAFHRSCWDNWSGISISCPVCRQVSAYRYDHSHEGAPTFSKEWAIRKQKFLSNFGYYWPSPKTPTSSLIIYPFWFLTIYRSFAGCWLGYAYQVGLSLIFGEILHFVGHFVLCFVYFCLLGIVQGQTFESMDPEFSKYFNDLTKAAIDKYTQSLEETANPVKFSKKKK